MRLEKIISLIREGKSVEVFVSDRNDCFNWDFLMYYIFTHKIMEFRPKMEKIKRYQVLYTDDTGKNLYLTSKYEKYTEAEFKHQFHGPDWIDKRIFHSLILESEEEFDK